MTAPHPTIQNRPTPPRAERDATSTPDRHHHGLPRAFNIAAIAVGVALIAVGASLVVDGGSEPALPYSEHDAMISQLLQQRQTVAPPPAAAHDSAIEQRLRERRSRFDAQHDSAIEQRLRERATQTEPPVTTR